MPPTSKRLPAALEPRIQDMDGVIRRQRKEIEDLRATLALIRTGGGGAWWNEGDISLKVAKLLRVMRLKYVKPHSPLERFAQWISGVTDAFLEVERARLLTDDDRVRMATPTLGQILSLADPYVVWRKRAEPELDRRSGAVEITHGPLISIVLPVYQISPRILEATLMSLRAQTYQDWEACIGFADLGPEGAASLALLQRYTRKDARFRLKVLADNFGISGNSNAAWELARGDYIALLDHDDELPPMALARMAAAIRQEPRADFLYSDKEFLSEGGERRYQPLFKPEWSPEMLYSVNYLTHLNLIRADLMTAIGGWAMGVDGAQDWDLFFRATERARCVVHVPGVSYSWRVHQASTASGIGAKPYALAAQLRTLERHAERIGLKGRFKPNADTGFTIAWDKVAPVRVVVFGSSDIISLETLISHLGRERKSFTQVDVLLTPRDSWRFATAWRKRKGRLPAWCQIHNILRDDPVETCIKALADAHEAATVFLDGGLLVCTPGALRQLGGWMQQDGPIAFASGVTVESDDHVIEAGCVLDEAGVAHPLFRGEGLRRWNLFGGPLWHRNVNAASPYMLAFRTADVRTAMPLVGRGGWQGVFHNICQHLVDQYPEGRGVVDPTARAIIEHGGAYARPAQGMLGSAQRYLHPFITIAPKGGMDLAKDLHHEAAVQAA
jgi:glycosyltransferase involved in cell wall biosynthesis